MQNYKTTNEYFKRFYSLLKPLITTLLIACCYFSCSAQNCPPNIDFESGTFNGWTCYTGYTSAVGSDNVITLAPSGGPVYEKHTMYSAGSGQTDFYGGFPVNCPNGSGNSIRLGSTEAGGQAEGISYEFTIPANENAYSLIYYYAVVFQAPNHRENEQPRMEIEITNVTDNTVISCASFTFIAVGSSLPGFEVSQTADTTTVLYKDWSAVSVDLSGNAGKTIRLFFKTADCTFRRHFGYAYIDVNSECNSSFVGATYCPDDTVINVVAPYGYQGYTWYDSTLTHVLGSQQTLTLSPPPPSGTTIAVKLEPYNGYGCPNTLFTQLRDSLTITAHAGTDALSCNKDPVNIGGNAQPGLIYMWTPATGLNNPNIANPVATPESTTAYIVTASNSGGGCKTSDTVVVRSSMNDNTLELIGKAAFCLGYGDSAVLRVQKTKGIEWFKDGNAINGAIQPEFRVTFSGTYYARLLNDSGCTISTQKQTIVIDKERPGINYPVEYAMANLPLVLEARQFGERVLWNPATSLDSPTSFTPTFKGVAEKLYTIEIRTITECRTVDTQLVKIIKNVEIYVPSAFTPNNDGNNDLLRPILKGIKEVFYFRIYNRMGQLMYDRKTDLPGWDGIFKGVKQPTQTVVWMLQCMGVDGVIHSKKGSCVLIK